MTDTTTEHSEPGQPAGLGCNEGLGLAELAKVCANHCREGLWQPNIMQNEQGVRLNAAMLLEQCAAEIRRMHAAVAAEREHVRIPASAAEAKAMATVAIAWLREHAPDELRPEFGA